MNRQPLELESCSNPLRPPDSASLLDDIEKKFLFLVCRLLRGTSQVGVFLHFFSHLSQALGPNPLGHSFGSRFLWKLGKNPRR